MVARKLCNLSYAPDNLSARSSFRSACTVPSWWLEIAVSISNLIAWIRDIVLVGECVGKAVGKLVGGVGGGVGGAGVGLGVGMTGVGGAGVGAYVPTQSLKSRGHTFGCNESPLERTAYPVQFWPLETLLPLSNTNSSLPHGPGPNLQCEHEVTLGCARTTATARD